MKEIWKDIEGYENIYKISNLGNVLSLNYGAKNHTLSNIKKQLKQSKSSTGYLHVQLYKNGSVSTKLVHLLVANAFLPNTENKSEINHIDGNKNNNSASNLEWVTHKENLNHAIKTGLRSPTPMLGKAGRKNKLSKKVVQLNLDGSFVKIWDSSYDAMHEGGFSQGSIRECASGHKKTHKGYIWKYAEE